MLRLHSKTPSVQLNFLHKLTQDYIQQKVDLSNFYTYSPSFEGALEAIEKRKFSAENRVVLVDALNRQYQKLKPNEAVKHNIEALLNHNVFTVTTGHQLALFTGPLYFIYKICGTIKLAQDLSSQLPDHKIVPIFWMATEDHDFEEIQSAHIGNKKLSWLRDASGAVGRLKTSDLQPVISQLQEFLGISMHANSLIALFQKAYNGSNTLAEATRIVVNQLFGHTGLVVVDGDDAALKAMFAPIMVKDIMEGISSHTIDATNKKLEGLGYKIQVNPRDVNFFYLTQDTRDRIFKTDTGFGVINNPVTFTAEQLVEEVLSNPERFSPNAVLRPLYQETILPNIAYIGGGAEVAYWLELKAMFDAHQILFPLVLLRDSAGILPQETYRKTDDLLLLSDVFLEETEYINKLIEKQAIKLPDFNQYRLQLSTIFETLNTEVLAHNSGLKDSIAARLKQSTKAIDSVEDKLMREMRKKQLIHKDRYFELKEIVFPSGKLQERFLNMSEFYTRHGSSMIDTFVEHFNPFEPCIYFFIEQ